MIELRRATDDDIKEVCARAREVYAGEAGIVDSSLMGIRNGPAFSIVNPGGDVGAVAGGVPVWEGVSRVWAITTDRMDLYPVAVARTLSRLLKASVAHYKIHRLEMVVKVGFEPGIKLAKFLGFEAEGLLRHYGPDKSDYLIFGRLS